MTTWYVATLASYVLVDAADETEARAKGRTPLYELYANVRKRLGRDVPINIRTVRPATDDEVELWSWQQETIAREPAEREA